MSEKVTMVAEVNHQTGTPAGMVSVGDEFEVSEAIARAYEERTNRRLARRKGTPASPRKAVQSTAPRKAAAKSARKSGARKSSAQAPVADLNPANAVEGDPDAGGTEK